MSSRNSGGSSYVAGLRIRFGQGEVKMSRRFDLKKYGRVLEVTYEDSLVPGGAGRVLDSREVIDVSWRVVTDRSQDGGDDGGRDRENAGESPVDRDGVSL